MNNKDLVNLILETKDLPILLVGDDKGVIFDRNEMLTDGIQRESNFNKSQSDEINEDLLDKILSNEPMLPVIL